MRTRSRLAVLASVAGLAASLLVAPPAVAAQPWDPKCQGDRVIRCVRLDVNSAGAVAIASVTDNQNDSVDYDVTITKVKLEVWDPAGWITVREATGDPGYQKEWDRAVTSGGGCDTYYRVHAYIHWRPVGGEITGEQLISADAPVSCQ